METATRYLHTIETLMVENSRLAKELQEALNGKLPSRIVDQEMADLCFHQIAGIIGPVAKGNLLDEVTFLCNEFKKIGQQYIVIVDKATQLVTEQKAVEKAAKGNDVLDEENTPIVNRVVRLRAVLEVIKTRLDRLVATGNNDVADLRKEVTGFLSGDKDEQP